jgi:broad-specificity NMP kinase
MTGNAEILLITGPAGIGKSTLSWALGNLLAEAQIAHAIIESDELDRVFPKPDAAQLEALSPGARDMSQINLAALWASYRALGHTRLIMSGVMLHLDFDRRWILAAIPGATILVVRLQANRSTLLERLDRRETGAGRDAQIERSLQQASRMSAQRQDGFLTIRTDERSPTDLATDILDHIGWTRPGAPMVRHP